jgi:hypothetical protein
MPSSLPAPIRSAIENGDAILFLGAGASYDALKAGKPTRIYADTVRDALSDKFLNGAHKNKSLMTVADYARSEASLAKVQALVRGLFIDLDPAQFHLKIPEFRWRAIVTTNYDLVVEKAYAASKGRLQEIAPVTRDGDELERALSGQNTVPYLKLHGCINNFNDTNIPIVLDSKEYAKFVKGRQNLVKSFAEWATQYPIIFCGYSLGDENIKEILFDIGDASQNRDAYLYVDLHFDDIQTRYWMQRRITPFENTFEGFLGYIDSDIPASNRVLASLLSSNNLSISKWIPSHTKPSTGLTQYLSEELIHVHSGLATRKAADAKAFYCGLDVSFAPIYANLDLRRSITNTILERAVLDTIPSTLPKLFLIKGYAGAGKSVLAKRVAVEASELLDNPLVVWLREGGIIRPEFIIELQQLVKSRLFVFIDDLVEHQATFSQFLEIINASQALITVIACVRTNELHIYGQTLHKYIAKDFELLDLENQEVNQLLEKLSAAKVLGPLEQYSEIDRKVFVQKFYEQQLLVALHEITYGDSFESIVVNEFENILPRSAQQLYLDICTLHQCGVGVRAGLVSRVSGLPISGLQSMLDGPLSKVIRSDYDHRYRDFVYRSRHPEIARMVFALAIHDPDARSHQLVRMISKIDLDYSSDNRAFFELMKGRRLAGLFDRKELALGVFDAADETSAPPGFLAHQRAILELNHPTGNLDVAMECLREAEVANHNTGFRDSSIQHTKANLLRKRALNSHSTIERERYRAEARAILKPQLTRKEGSYPEHLYGQLLLDEIKDYFFQNGRQTSSSDDTEEMREQSIVRVVNELSQLIDDHLHRNPGDGAMTLLRSDFLKRIGEFPSALNVLERFHKKNPNNTSISRVFAEALSTGNDLERGISILRATVLASPGDMAANLAFAKLLMRQNEEANANSILSYLRRSFADGDTHYEARLLYARFNLLYGDLNRGAAEFDLLRQVYIQNRDKPIAPVEIPGKGPKRFVGTVISKEGGFAFLKSPELRFNVFFRKGNLTAGVWHALNKGSAVTFILAFNYRGSIAVDLELITQMVH